MGDGHSHQPLCPLISVLQDFSFWDSHLLERSVLGNILVWYKCCTSLSLQPKKGGLLCMFSNCLALVLAAVGENYTRFLRTCNFQLPQNKLTSSYCRGIKLFKSSMHMPRTTGEWGWEEFIPCVKSLHLLIKTSLLWTYLFSLVYEDEDTCLFQLFNSAILSPSC